jgi:hypothetical protein
MARTAFKVHGIARGANKSEGPDGVPITLSNVPAPAFNKFFRRALRYCIDFATELLAFVSKPNDFLSHVSHPLPGNRWSPDVATGISQVMIK